MATFMHKNNGRVAEYIKASGDIVTLKNTEDNEIFEVSIPTFKRWWAPVVPGELAQVITTKASIDQVATEVPKAEETLAESSEADPVECGAPEEVPALALSDIIKKLETLFDLLNKVYFDSKLDRPAITVQSTPRAYGHCTARQIWKADSTAFYEINIGAEHLNRPSENTAATMCHEMVHLFCRTNNLAETCQKGRYHNKLFKQECEARDLAIGYDRAIGYSLTEPTEAFKQKLSEAGLVLDIPFARHTLELKGAIRRRTKAHKYVCPECGQSVRSTSDLSIICGICEEPMAQEG